MFCCATFVGPVHRLGVKIIVVGSNPGGRIGVFFSYSRYFFMYFTCMHCLQLLNALPIDFGGIVTN